jgi:hypothetical protein
MPRKRKRRALVAWLGLFALLLDALVPIHLAFDLAESLGLDRAPIAAADPMRPLLAELVGHESQPDKPDRDHHHHHDCAVCAAAGTLGAVTAPSPAALPVPTLAAQPILLAALRVAPPGASFAAYRSRAPPLG